MAFDLSSIFPITQNAPLKANSVYESTYNPTIAEINPITTTATFNKVASVSGVPPISYAPNSTPVSIAPKTDILGIIDNISGVVKAGTGLYNSVRSQYKEPQVTNIPTQVVSGEKAATGQQGVVILPPTNSTNTTGQWLPQFAGVDSSMILVLGGVLLLALFLSKGK